MNIANQNKFTRLAAMMLTVLGLTTLSTQTFAKGGGGGGGGVLLGLNLSYSTDKDETTTTTTTTNDYKTTLMDIKLGYQAMSGLYFGLLYINDTGSSNSTNKATTGYGPTLGYMANNGFFIHATYLLDGEYDASTADSFKYKKGTGIQADLGYLFPVSSSFLIGAELSYRSIKYGTYYNGTADVTTQTRTNTSMDPKISLAFIF